MFSRLKSNILFWKLLKRPDIDKAYAMVGPEDSWYDTITTVHNSLAQIQTLPHAQWQITSHDGLSLQAVFYPGTTNKTILWIHGYTSHADRESAFPGLFYHSLGFNVLIPYLRAHGPSQGKYISFGALEQKDMLQWVKKINEMVPGGQILLHGLSMGGGIALYLADQEMENVKGMVVDAPNTSIQGFMRNVSFGVFKKDKHPERIFKCMKARFEKEFGVNPADYEALERVKNGKYPLLLSAGSNEEMDTVLAQLKENNPIDTTILILPGCNHGNGMYKQTQLYQTAIQAFVEKNLK